MLPWIPAAITAGASLIGGLLQNRGQRSAAREQMDFQKEMSNTAYRRARTDLEAGGYSPYLAYGQGGATTPGGAQASVSDVIGPAVSSAMSAQRLRGDLKLITAQESKVKKESDAVDYQNARDKAWFGIDEGTIPIDSPLGNEMRAARASRRTAEAEASNAEWENTEARRWQRLLFGGQGAIPGIGGAVGRIAFPKFGQGGLRIGPPGSMRSLGVPRPEFHKTIRGFRR